MIGLFVNRLRDSNGGVVITPRPAGGIPATSLGQGRQGWAVASDGSSYSEELGSTPVPSTAIRSQGLAFTPDGALYTTVSAPTSTSAKIGGFAVRADGALHLADSSTVGVKIQGIALTADGRLITGGTSFDLPLVNMTSGVFTLTPRSSSGSSTPTYTRATAATTIDFEGLLKTCLSGEVRCLGGRRVENLIPAAGTGSASLAVAAAKTMTLPAGDYVFSMGAGTGTATFSGTGGATGTLAANATNRTSVLKTITAGTLIVTASVATLVDLQTENVTGQANQNPASYVSNGVASVTSPVYHGVGVDGVKVFTTLNGNTVASNVVTEATGLPITSARAECAGGVTAGVVDAVGPVGYLAEGARTNLCLQSNTFNNASWTSALGTLTQNTTGPDGAVSAWTATDNSAVAFLSVSQLLTIVNTTTYAHSIFVQKTSGATVFPVFEVGQGDGINYFGAVINTNTGVITAATGGAYVAPTSVSAHSIGDFWRVIIVGTSNGVTCRFSFYPAASSNGTTVGAASLTGSAVIYGAQLEAAAFASTYIPTTTAAVARNADVLTYVAAGNINDAQGAAYIEATTFSTTGNGSSSIPLAFSSSGSLLYLNSGDVRTVSNLYDGTTAVTKTGLTDISTAIRKRACSWGGGGMSITGDGATPATSVFDGSLGSTSITIGAATGSTAQWFGPMRNVRIYPRALSAAQLQAMTA